MTQELQRGSEINRKKCERGLRVKSSQRGIRSKGRVRNLGEVFTPEHIVNDMLDMVDQQAKEIESRFLEPSCGTGNFLVEILRRKLNTVREESLELQNLEFNTLLSLSSIYGIDIDLENVLESQRRMKDITLAFLAVAKPNAKHTPGFIDAIDYVLSKNIGCGDMLNGQHKIYFTEFIVESKQTLKQRVFRLCDLRRKGLLQSARPVPIKEESERNYWEIAVK